jgi:hypothetical protein
MTKITLACVATIAFLLSTSFADAQQRRPANARSVYASSVNQLPSQARGQIPITWYEKALADRDKDLF